VEIRRKDRLASASKKSISEALTKPYSQKTQEKNVSGGKKRDPGAHASAKFGKVQQVGDSREGTLSPEGF
jgi:hypothetical protein